MINTCKLIHNSTYRTLNGIFYLFCKILPNTICFLKKTTSRQNRIKYKVYIFILCMVLFYYMLSSCDGKVRVHN